ncbi:ABC transporter permease [Cohnella rhizosphaerae]|uniref:ABC transporter permease n=1 Tax=Cohnella rhizosphaerae TaxID=1457232 RepID=A0A9X4KN66_9BACL|nr:ABC transporter permease [Cohnella rhizosphaerae]MDG0808009.1 ABC transporter permease [Cohnella rhizosphaerae]
MSSNPVKDARHAGAAGTTAASMGTASAPYKKYLRAQRRLRMAVWLARFALLAAFLGVWELAADRKWVDAMLTSRPSQLVASFKSLALEGKLWHHAWVTTSETVIGLTLSMAIGTAIAVALWWSSYASRVLEPYMVVLNALPKVALGPIFYIWLGDRYSVYGMAIAISVIVTIMMLESGFKEIGQTKLRLMESFGATKLQTLRMVLLPASVPNLVATLKVNVGLTLVGVIMGEFLSSKAGLGYMIIYGGQVFQMDMVMVAIALLAALSMALYGVVSLLGRFALRRHPYD